MNYLHIGVVYNKSKMCKNQFYFLIKIKMLKILYILSQNTTIRIEIYFLLMTHMQYRLIPLPTHKKVKIVLNIICCFYKMQDYTKKAKKKKKN